MRLACLLFLCLVVSLVSADSPFPDSPKNHWVYASMRQIKQNHLWYRVNDGVPRRKVPTRMDLATKTLFLAIDSKNLVDSLARTTNLVNTAAADDPASRKWAVQYKGNFPNKKQLYKAHVKRVLRLWAFFKPEILQVAKSMKIDPTVIGKNLQRETKELDGIHLGGSVASVPDQFADVPPGHWAAEAVGELKAAGILVGYPKGQ